MSMPLYFGLWLVAALVAIGFLSAFVARQRRWRELRRQQGVLMLAALERYTDWVGLQQHATEFRGESPEAAQALDEACTLRIAWFPELAGEMAQLLGVHNRLMHFLAAQQALRLQDAEAWLETDHEARFVALAQLQELAITAMRQRLQLVEALDEPAPVAPVGLARADLRETT